MISQKALKLIQGQINEDEMLKNPNRKKELIKIILQTLENLGFKETQKILENESKIQLDNKYFKRFKICILKGDYEQAIKFIKKLGIKPELKSDAKFFIQKQQYFELLLEKQNDKALFLLRKELQKIQEKSQLYDLSILLAYPDNQQKIYSILGTQNLNDARKLLIKQFIVKFKPKNTLQANFLEKALKDAFLYQILLCPQHVLAKNPQFSLLSDHSCQVDLLPDVCVQVLKNQNYIHREVWISQFSNNGKKLATISTKLSGQTHFEKNTLTVWDFDLDTFKAKYKYHIPKLHEREVNYLSWSKNDSKLITCSQDGTITLLNGEKDEVYKVLKGHERIVQCAIFHPINNKIYSAGVDNYIIIWNQIGIEESRIQSNRIKELTFTSDGKYLITLGLALPIINVIDTETKQIIKTINEKNPLLCMSLSQNNKHLLVSTAQKKSQLNLWDIETAQLINQYQGHTQSQFQIMAQIGGPSNDYVTSGSEDGICYIWNKFNSQKMEKIQAHKMPINDITYNPQNPSILATASDDGTVKIWLPRKIALEKNLTIVENHIPKIEVLEYEEDIESIESSSSQVRIIPQIQQMHIEEEEDDEEAEEGEEDEDEDDEENLEHEGEDDSQILEHESQIEEEGDYEGEGEEADVEEEQESQSSDSQHEQQPENDPES